MNDTVASFLFGLCALWIIYRAVNRELFHALNVTTKPLFVKTPVWVEGLFLVMVLTLIALGFWLPE